MRYILSRAASLGRDRVVGIWDVSCAFLHAGMDELVHPLATYGRFGLLSRAHFASYRTW